MTGGRSNRIRAGATLLLFGGLFVAAGAGGAPAASIKPFPGSSVADARVPSATAAAGPLTEPSPTGLALPPEGQRTVCPGTTPTSVASLGLAGSTARTSAMPAATEYHVPVLMYHRIEPASERGRDLADLVIGPSVFDAQLAALEAHGWHTITSAQLARAVTADEKLPARTFVITVDDGREDGFRNAFPILLKHGFVATFFVVTGRVDERRYLTWTELCEMHAAGMEIGNHTANHRDETMYTRSQTDREVMAAQKAIMRNLGEPAISFAYPFGQRPANLVASVAAAGLEVAYTTVGGADETVATALFWPRVRVHPTTTPAGILWLAKLYG